MPENNEALELEKELFEWKRKNQLLLNSLGKKEAEALEGIIDKSKKLAGSTRDQDTILRQANYSLNQLDKALKSGRKSYTDVAGDLHYLQEQVDELTDANERAAKQSEINKLKEQSASAHLVKAVVDSAETIAVATANYGINVYKSLISSYQSNASAFQAAGELQTLQIDRNVEVVKGMTGAASSAMTGLGVLSAATGGAAAPLWALGAAATAAGGFLFEKYEDLKKFKIQTLSKEMDGAVKAMQTVSSAGATFAGGLMELRQLAEDAYLDQTQFANAIKNNTESLIKFGGSVTQGAKQFSMVSNAMGTNGFTEQLLNLGLTFEDIADGTIHYMGVLGMAGDLQRKNAQDIAKETRDWLVNIKAISAFTGEDAKKAQARAEAATMQTQVLSKLREEAVAGGGTQEEIADRFKKLVEGFQQNLKTLGDNQETQTAYMQQRVYGFITQQGFLMASAQAPAIRQMVEEAAKNSRNISNEAARTGKATVTTIQQMSKPMLNQVGKTGFGQVNLLTGEYGDVQGIYQNAEKLSLAGTKMADVFGDATKALTSGAGDPTHFAEQMMDWQSQRIEIMKGLDGGLGQFSDMIKEIYDDLYNYRDKLGFVSPEEKQRREANGRASAAVSGAHAFGSSGGGAAIGGAHTGIHKPATAGGIGGSAGTAAPASVSEGGGDTELYGTEGPGRSLTRGLSQLMPPNVGRLITNGRAGTGGITPQLQDMLDKMNSDSVLSHVMINALNDSDIFAAHKNDVHGWGKAIDINPLGDVDTVVAALKAIGFSRVDFEKKGQEILRKDGTKVTATGDHVHAQLASGGIVNPSSGGSNVTVAEGGQRELVTPLVNGMLPGMQALLDKFDEMINILEDHKDISENHFRAVA
jgi:hypothetical protein